MTSTTIPEEAVKEAVAKALRESRWLVPAPAVELILTAALPHLPGVGVKKLDLTILERLAEYAEQYDHPDENGPFPDIQDAMVTVGDLRQARKLLSIISAIEPSAARELMLEEAAHNLINELSGNTGELIDKMAEAIRDWGSHYDDGPWETLPEDRKAGWRGDAERALAVVKEYLTARRPSEQAVTEAMVEAVQRIRNTAMRQSIVARIPECGEFGGIAQDADWLLDTLKAAREAGR